MTSWQKVHNQFAIDYEGRQTHRITLKLLGVYYPR